MTKASDSYPKVLVVGEAASGKTTIIGKVLSGCARSSRGNVCLETFWEGNPFVEVAATQQLAAKADSVWVVVNATRQMRSSELELFRSLLMKVRFRALVVTNLDSIDEPFRKDVFATIRQQCLDAETFDAEDLIVDGSGKCSELIDFYWSLCDEKADADSRRQESERMAEYDRIVKSGLLDFDFDRYRDSVFYYCMPHDEESESEYKRTMKPPFEISETFKKRIRLVLQTPAPQLYLDHPDLRDIPAKGWDLIQAIQHGFGYWRDNATDEVVASKAKYVVDKIEENSCEMGVAGNLPSVADYVDDVLDYAARMTKGIGEGRTTANLSQTPTSTFPGGAISGCALVESILNHFGDKGVEKLLECTANQETEYLELKTSYLLSEEDRENGESQDELNWNIAQGIIAIANTAGGALVIGIKSDNRTILPVRVIGDVESFLRGKIIQRILPDQRRWNGGRSGMWQSDELPRVEPRLCRYSDGKQSGRVVVILIEPRPKGQCIKLEDAVNRNKCLLLQRKAGVGKDSLRYDSDKFDELDNTRRIERGAYAALLRKLIPNSGVSPIGGSSGAYQFKSVGRGADVSVDPLLRQTDGHQLRCEFHPGDRIDKYSIVERIGGGGMGVVYKVRHFATRKEFALKAFKMVSEDSSLLKERFAAEAKVMMRLDHKGLPKVYGYDYDDRAECLYLVQDLIVGDEGKPQELGGFVVDPGVAEREGKRCISHQIALGWLRQVCEIAEYLHGRKLAHRDITLKNLLVDADGNIKLTDFGIAKVMDPALRDELKCEVTLTVAQVPGTFHYLPPEVREKRKADISPESTDVWAIGVSFFKLLTGKWPDNEQFDDYGWYKTIWGTLLKGMLRTDSSKRMSCAEVLCSLAGYEKTAFQDLEMALGSAAQKNATANCIIVDADNILYGSNEEGPRLLRSMLIALARRGFVPRVYYTKGNRAVEKCRDMLKGIEACVVIECDNAETFMLDDCSRRLWRIVSNDKFSILQAEYKCLQGSGFNGESPLCPYVISNDTFTIAKIGVGGAL